MVCNIGTQSVGTVLGKQPPVLKLTSPRLHISEGGAVTMVLSGLQATLKRLCLISWWKSQPGVVLSSSVAEGS